MGTVTVHPPGSEPMATQPAAYAPQQQAQAEVQPRALPPGVEQITDDRGRILTVRTIGPRDRMRLFKAIGPVNSRNDPYVGTATLAYSVSEIDGEPVPIPATEIAVEALVDRLGDDGINAVAKVMMHRMGITDADMEAAGGDAQAAAEIAAERKRKEMIAAAKNSAGMPPS